MAIPASDGDTFEAKLHGMWNGQVELNNIFHFIVSNDGGATLQEFGAGFWAKIAGPLLAITSSLVVYDTFEVNKLDASGLAIYGEPYVIPVTIGQGLDVAEALPPEVCMTYKYVRTLTSERHGFKRFGGVTEGIQVAGLPSGGAVSLLDDLAVALRESFTAWSIDPDTGEPDTENTGAIMTPVVQRSFLNGDPLDEPTYYFPTTVIFDRFGTQNSRKIGVGS